MWVILGVCVCVRMCLCVCCIGPWPCLCPTRSRSDEHWTPHRLEMSTDEALASQKPDHSGDAWNQRKTFPQKKSQNKTAKSGQKYQEISWTSPKHGEAVTSPRPGAWYLTYITTSASSESMLCNISSSRWSEVRMRWLFSFFLQWKGPHSQEPHHWHSG